MRSGRRWTSAKDEAVELFILDFSQNLIHMVVSFSGNKTQSDYIEFDTAIGPLLRFREDPCSAPNVMLSINLL